MTPLGLTPITTCPHCSKLVEGSCQVCGPFDQHPSCERCEGGRIVVPWYENELFIAVVTTVIVSVASAVIISSIQNKWKEGKKKSG